MIKLTGKEYTRLCRAYNQFIWKHRGRFIKKELQKDWKVGYMRDDNYKEDPLTWEE